MTKLRTMALSLVGAALIAPSLAFAAPAAPAAAPKVDDVACMIQLMWFVSQGREVAADPKESTEERAKTYAMVEHMRGALGFYQARVIANPPVDLKALAMVAYDKMDKMPKDELVSSAMACLDNFDRQEEALLAKLK